MCGNRVENAGLMGYIGMLIVLLNRT